VGDSVSKGRVLIVEDDISLARMLSAYLKKHAFDPETVSTGADLFKKVDAETFDALIIDLTLPDEDGIVLVRKMRARSQVPIIVLTGRNQIEDKMACFDLGADYYIVKPVDPRELEMRLQAVMRRSEGQGSAPDQLQFGSVMLDHSRRTATEADGEVVELTPAEFSMVWVIANAEGKVLSREDLVDAIATGEGPLSFRAVDIIISRLRKKLDKAAIETVPTVGYKGGWEVSRAP